MKELKLSLIKKVLEAIIEIFSQIGFINLRRNGIKYVYPKGKDIKSIEKMISSKNCKEIKILAFSAESFSHGYRKELTNFVAGGGNLTYLLAKQNTDFLRTASEMEGRPSMAFSDSVGSAIGIIKGIRKDAQDIASKTGIPCGKIKLRFFDTEIRNQLIICIDTSNQAYAWMTILMPPLAAVNCRMIEFNETAECMKYFDTIWNRHKEDEYNFEQEKGL